MIGLVPTLPTIADAYTSVIPVLLRIVKVPADLRLTGACVMATFADRARGVPVAAGEPLPPPPHPASNAQSRVTLSHTGNLSGFLKPFIVVFSFQSLE